jgi:hypothetical protein
LKKFIKSGAGFVTFVTCLILMTMKTLVENENQKEKQNESKKAFMLLNQKLDSENVGESKCI